MKKLAFVCLLAFLFATRSAVSQESSALTRPGWNYGLFGGYGNGISDDADFHRFTIGGRIGRVLSGVHGPGLLRGTFQWDAEVTPFEILHYGETTYAAGITPIVWKWNFTGPGKRKIVPFFEAAGGALFSAEKFPPGDTSRVNFQSGAGLGFNAFTRENRAITFNFRALHISNASIGNRNPGINAQLQFQIGYTWFK